MCDSLIQIKQVYLVHVWKLITFSLYGICYDRHIKLCGGQICSG